MKTNWIAAALLGMVFSGATMANAGDLVKCHMTFTLEGWSVFYKSASGRGEVTCENGQSARVDIRAKGGGLTFGKTDITNGIGDFTGVVSIDQIFGKYASAGASAAAGKAAMAQVVTKGPVSLALSGKGTGVDIGFAFGEFVIDKEGSTASKEKKKK